MTFGHGFTTAIKSRSYHATVNPLLMLTHLAATNYTHPEKLGRWLF